MFGRQHSTGRAFSQGMIYSFCPPSLQHPGGGPGGLPSLTQQLPGPLLSALAPLLSPQAPVLCALRPTGQHQEPVGGRLHRQAPAGVVRRRPVQQRSFPQRRERPGLAASEKELRLISFHALGGFQHFPSVPLGRLQHVCGRQRGLLLRRRGL